MLNLVNDLSADSATKCLWPAPYSEDSVEAAKAFVYDLVWTFEETTGEDWRIERRDYIDRIIEEWYSTWKEGRAFYLEKSRRLVGSWTFRALEVWDAGRRGIGTIIVGPTHKKAADHIWRTYHIYEGIRKRNPEWGLAPAKSWGPVDLRLAESVMLPNGATFTEFHQEGEALRGSGVGRVSMEELSSFDNIANSIGQAGAITMGPPGQIGGHVAVIANCSNALDWCDLIAGYSESVMDVRLGHPDGMEAYDTPKGNRVLRIHYTADPGKRSKAWESSARATFGSTREWNLEMEMMRNQALGPLVFPEIRPNIHVPERFRHEPWPRVEGSTYWLGWDCGTASPNMSAVLFQVTPWPECQIMIVGEQLALSIPAGSLQRYENSIVRAASMETFAPHVKEWWQRQRIHRPYSYGDETGRNRQGATGRTAFQVARSKGVRIRPVANNWQSRAGAVVWALEDWVDQSSEDPNDWKPRLIICAKAAPITAAAFEYGYKASVGSAEADGGMGAVYRKPKKDIWSHIMDGAQYGLVRIKRYVQTGKLPEQEEDYDW